MVEGGEYLLECSRYIHLNPNRSRITRPAVRYRWSSYRNHVGGPVVADWVETQRTLREFNGDRKSHRAFIQAGEGERPVDPFERADFVRDIPLLQKRGAVIRCEDAALVGYAE